MHYNIVRNMSKSVNKNIKKENKKSKKSNNNGFIIEKNDDTYNNINNTDDDINKIFDNTNAENTRLIKDELKKFDGGKIKSQSYLGVDEILTVDDLFKIYDLYFYREHVIYRHLFNSYNKFIEEDVVRFLLNGYHIFSETITPTTYYKNRFEYSSIRIDEPKTFDGRPLYPAYAIHHNLTYSIKIYANVSQYVDIIDIASDRKETKQIDSSQDIVIATIPLMLRSKWCSLTKHKDTDEYNLECPWVPGGHFIVGGNEKVIISQDKMAENKPIVVLLKYSGSALFTVQVNSRSYNPHGITQVLRVIMKKNNIMSIHVPILNEINVCSLFRALGIESDRDIIRLITYDENDIEMANMIRFTLKSCVDEKGKIINTQEKAYDYLITRMRDNKIFSDNKEIQQEQQKIRLKSLLLNNFIPHVEGSLYKKALYLGYMINRLLRVVLKRSSLDDRDSYINKRIDLPGDLMFDLFKQQYRKMMGDCKKYFDARNNDINKPIYIISNIKPNMIEQGFKKALSTGQWIRKQGVAQVLSKLSYKQILSFLRRIDAPEGDASSSKLTGPRKLDPNSIPFNDPVQTPEHAKVGLTKHLTLVSTITVSSREQTLILKNYLLNKIIHIDNATYEMLNNPRIYKVFLNGDWLGLADNYLELDKQLNEMKYKNKINQEVVSIVTEHECGEIRIYSDSGRLVRPTLRVSDNKLFLTKEQINKVSLVSTDRNKITTWDEFIDTYPDTFEFIDMELQPFLLVADKIETVYNMREKMIKAKEYKPTDAIINRYDNSMYQKYTNCELHPSLLLGEIVVNIPFLDHNAGTRGIFAYSQGRQAMGIYSSDYGRKLDISYILYYPQRSLVSTRPSRYVNSDILPCGENVIVAIACYTGYNQEDSLIFNKTSIQTGKFRGTYLKKHVAVIQKNQTTGDDDKFMKPDPSKVINSKPGAYDKLNDKGYAPHETKLENGDVIFGMISPINDTSTTGGKPYRDKSEIYKSNVDGVVDGLYLDIQNQEGYLTRKARVRSERVPMIGDKYASCYTSDHEVLTTDGWIPINKITTKHKVASLHNGNELKYVKPKEIMEYDVKDDEELYHIKSNQIDLVVTKNHRMWVRPRTGKYKIEKAEDIYGSIRCYMKNVEKWNPENSKDTFTIKGLTDVSMFKKNKREEMKRELIFNMNDWLIFFGIWIAEGCAKHETVSIATHKQRVKDALIEICEKMKIEYTKHKNHTNDDVRNMWEFTDKRLTKYLTPLSVGSVNKSLPKWVWNLTQEQCRTLISGMMLGDGHTMKNGTEIYDTSSTKLADDFQRLCLHAGWSCNKIIKYKAGKISYVESGKNAGTTITSNVDAYRLTIIKSQNEPLVNKNITTDGKNRHDNYITFDNVELKNCIKNKVYCCSVEGTGVIYIRRNNIVAWSGNSHGQKGTIGIMLDSVDMPFTKNGLVPDIILNPNAFPSRMTVGQLIECIMGKAAVLEGMDADGTPFEKYNFDSIGEILKKHGYEADGTEYLYNGMTGEKMKTKIFIGPTYYQRLKHLVADKIHCLNSNNTQVLTMNGWKCDNELTLNDKIAILKNDKLIYENPINIFRYSNYNGEMYRVKNDDIEIDVTTNHRMWVSELENKNSFFWSKYKFVEADKIIGKPVRYKRTAQWLNEDYQLMLLHHEFDKFVEKNVDMNAWLMFFGIWFVNKSKKERNVDVIIMNTNEIKNNLCESLDKLNYCYEIIDNELILLDKQLIKYLNLHNNEYMPEWIFKLSHLQSVRLLDALNLDETQLYSNEFTDCIQTLCLHAGFVCNIIDQENGLSKIKIIKTNKNSVVNHPRQIDKKCEEYIYNYTGPVFCLEVSTGVFMVRTNGKPYWTGNSRSRGLKTNLTRQAPEGRAKDGGLRLGEMEKDALISHGLSKCIKEKLMDNSDAYTTYVCDICGLFAQRFQSRNNDVYPKDTDMHYCHACNNHYQISKIRIPYACKLFFQELMCMSIAPRIRCKKSE